MNFEKEKEEVLSELGLSEFNSGVYAGDWIENPSGKKIESISPIDGSRIATVATGSLQDYDRVIKAAKMNVEKWFETPAPARGELIRKIGEELRKKKKILGKIVSIETGKTVVEGEGEIQEMIDISDYSVGLSRQLFGLQIASERKKHRMYEQYHPLGIIGIITSFNFPSSVWSWNSFVASVVGNISIWKPSSKAMLTSIAVMKTVTQIVKDNGFPDVFFLITGSGEEIGNKISSDPNIKLVSFTGSVRSGRKVSEDVSKRFGKVILELGGNNAAIVTSKADINLALKGVAFGALATAGQRCTTTRRLILHESIYDDFLERLKQIYSNVRVGNPLEDGVLVGPLIDSNAIKNFKLAIDRAVKEGGRIVYGGVDVKIPDFEGGFYVKPTIIEMPDVTPITCEETFAPILYVFKYKKIEDAIRIHNSVPQGLSSSIFTTDLREEELFLSAAGSDCGLANVNTATAGAEIGGAFGGEKDTGGGRESGSDAWKNYARRQTVTVNWGDDIPLAQGVRFDV
ncbi:MAG: aldehyde dehydrogenase family protein [Thermoplasmatales archaeon]